MRQVNTSGYTLTVHLPDGPVEVAAGDAIDHEQPVAGFTPAPGKTTKTAAAPADNAQEG